MLHALDPRRILQRRPVEHALDPRLGAQQVREVAGKIFQLPGVRVVDQSECELVSLSEFLAENPQGLDRLESARKEI